MLDILLITGGAGSGKTSTAEAWAASRSGLAAHLSHDAVLHFVKSGVISPADDTGAEAERQWRIAIDVCIAACRIYAGSGIRCAVDTFLLPATVPLWAGLQDLRVGVIVLRPDVEVAVSRNAARLREAGWGVPEWQVRANHEAMGAWVGRRDAFVIDNSKLGWVQILTVLDEWEGSVVENRGGVSPLLWPQAAPE